MPANASLELAGWTDALTTLNKQLGALNELLEKQAERSEGLEKCWQRGIELAARIAQWQKADSDADTGFV